MVADARLTVALDLSDDERFRAALVDLGGKVRTAGRPSGTDVPEAAAAELAVALATELAEAADRPLLGVGIGSPGVVDAVGHVLEAPNRGWHDLDLAAQVHEVVDAPVHVANDANAVALAARTAGAGRTAACSPVKIGQVSAPAWSSTATWCWATASPPVRSATWWSTPTACPVPVGAGAASRPWSPPPACATATAAGPRPAGQRLGEALAPVISTLNLREVVLSGPLDVLDETFRSAALAAVRDRTMPAVGDHADIRFSSLGEDDVLLGAAMLVLDRELGVA